MKTSRVHLEIHTHPVNPSTLSMPNVDDYSYRFYEKALQWLKTRLNTDEKRFFKEKTLEEVIVKYNITPTFYEPDYVLRGYISIVANGLSRKNYGGPL